MDSTEELGVDERFMTEALKEASKALARDEVPIGAVVVINGQIVARAHNLTETLIDPTAHAEMQAITAATAAIGGKYLPEATIYVTVEPCPMCAAALYWAQIGKLVYGAHDPKRGYTTISPNLLHPKTVVKKGVLSNQASLLMKDFFRKKR
ncbi:MAG TPA: nucleoside deaminase [Williamwhitmania sp.]|nr:nucleoside deaminase [Williamwhitmania sp.]